jgi:N-acetylmuramoyl-L-alanine amidase
MIARTAGIGWLVLLAACGTAEVAVPETAPAPLPALDDAAAMSCSLDALHIAVEAWSAHANGTSEEGVAASRTAARLLRIEDYRGAGEDDLARASALLLEASLRRQVAGACEAAIDLVRLQARDLGELTTAYETAYRTVRRFRDPVHTECVSEARRILSTLESARPDAALLAAIDADPDRDDPSAFRDGEDEAPAHADATPLEAWARARAIRTAPAALTALVAFGERGANGARVMLTFDHVVEFEREELQATDALPRRLSISLPGARLASGIAANTSVGAGGLVRVRASADDAGARVVLDLEAGAELQLYALPDPFRIVVDVAPPEGARAAGAPALSLVVIDPGHGGDDYGARAFGLHEADLTLDLALRVRSSLLALRPDLRVVLTREDDTFVSLEQRAAMANAIDADIFVSIHLNAADEPVDHGGITTFVLDTETDRSAVRLAARENGTSTAEVTELQRILAGLHRADQVAGSRLLAEGIHDSLLRGGRTVLPRLHDRGVRSAMFYVLVGATMPAVLVEASFMTRQDEADALRTTRYRDALAAGIAEGIAGYGR